MKRKDLGIPAADDLAGWKEADSRLTRRFVDQMNEEGFWSAQARKGYFGDDDARALLVAHEARAVAQAYTTWAILDYRPHRPQAPRPIARWAGTIPVPAAAGRSTRSAAGGEAMQPTCQRRATVRTPRKWAGQSAGPRQKQQSIPDGMVESIRDEGGQTRVYTDMEQRTNVRREVLVEKTSKRGACTRCVKPITVQAFVQGPMIECRVNDAYAFSLRAYDYPEGKLCLEAVCGRVSLTDLTISVPKEGN